jgi:hypothetical protein
MAKKTAKNPESPSTGPAAPVKRRAATSRKAPANAAPAVDVATIGGTEPLANASDTRANTTASNTMNSTSSNGDHQPSHDEIAQAAYFRHLNRGGSSGDEFEDWVEAERELRERRRS